eukprot:COSAG01_NODE_142_length_24198_cov_8.924893_7_plen_710_part_00
MLHTETGSSGRPPARLAAIKKAVSAALSPVGQPTRVRPDWQAVTKTMVKASTQEDLPPKTPGVSYSVSTRSKAAATHESAIQEDIAELFAAFDVNHDGTIEAGEFGSALARLGIGLDTAGLTSLFTEIDANKNGEIGLKEWSQIMRGLKRKIHRRVGTHDDVCRAVNCILEEAELFKWQNIEPGFANIGLIIEKKLPGTHVNEVLAPIHNVINSQRRERSSSGLISLPQLPLETQMEEVGMLEFGGAVYELLCTARDDVKCDLGWSTTNSSLKDRVVELWRQAVRRFLWLELLHEAIEDCQTMHGTASHKAGRTEKEIRTEITARCFFFAPDHAFVGRWDLFQAVVLIVLAIILPLRGGFEQIDTDSPRFWFTFDLILDVYFYFDILLNFRTAFYDRDHVLQSKPTAVAWNYLTGWFTLDILSCAPVNYVIYITDPTMLPWRVAESDGDQSSAGSIKLLKLLRLVRLTKMVRMLKLKSILEKYEDSRLMMMFRTNQPILTVVGVLMYMTHILACIWYYLGAMGEIAMEMPDGQIVHGWVYRQMWGSYGWPGRYLTSFWHSITDETAEHAETDVEKIWSSIQHVLYEMLMAYLTGVFAGEIVEGNAGKQKYKEKVSEVQEFYRHYKLSWDIRRDIASWLQHFSETKTFFDEQEILRDFPPSIRKRIIKHIYSNIVDDKKRAAALPLPVQTPNTAAVRAVCGTQTAAGTPG